MNRKVLLLTFVGLSLTAKAQTFDFDMTKAQPVYSVDRGYGYDMSSAPENGEQKPYYFSVKVPDGNYRVTFTIGGKKAANTTVRAEDRRLLLYPTDTRKKEKKTYSFLVSKRSPLISGKDSVRLKPGERKPDCLDWDDKLTLEINGNAPLVSRIKIEKVDNGTTLFLCGNSTVTDQRHDPYASWGQMITQWFDDKLAVCNVAESGLTASSFLAQKRLDKILSMLKPGDWVICEFGHNDEKEKAPGSGAWFNYTYALKKYVDMVRAKGGEIVFCTPTQRRHFDGDTIRSTHGEYPAAMKLVAEKCNVPLIDLTQMSTTMYETMGVENSKKTLVHYPAGTFPGQEKDLADNTHFNPFGAGQIAKMVVMGLKQNNIPVIKHLLSIWKDYDPSKPDDYNAFVWPLSASMDITKPDGN